MVSTGISKWIWCRLICTIPLSSLHSLVQSFSWTPIPRSSSPFLINIVGDSLISRYLNVRSKVGCDSAMVASPSYTAYTCQNRRKSLTHIFLSKEGVGGKTDKDSSMNQNSSTSSSTTTMANISGKGFAKNVSSPSTSTGFSKKKQSGMSNEPTDFKKTSIMDSTIKTSSSFVSSEPQETASSPSSTSLGKEALARLRRTDIERRNEELRSMQELKKIDQSLQEDPSLAVIPETVAMRMGKRMLPFVGIPLFGSMGAFVLFWYLATYKNLEIPTVMVAYLTIAILAVGLLGITYSVMSASWDAEKEGSALGIDEFKENLKNVKDGLQRSRENAILRDKMRLMSDEEIQRNLISSGDSKKTQSDADK